MADAANFTAAVTGVIHAAITQNAAVVSSSGSHGEHLFTPAEVARLHAALQQAAHRHVTVVASSGDTGVISDNGPPVQVSLPASDPLVLGAGGTALDASYRTGAYHGEMAWNADTEASAGGYSSLFPRPAYQDGVACIGRMRGVPDVAADADASTAMTLTFTGGVLYPAQGTSAATPLWAAVIALADQDAGHHLGLVNPTTCAIARSPAYHLPRRGHRRQLGVLAHRALHRLHRRTRMGPGHRLGQPQRPHPRPPPSTPSAPRRHRVLTTQPDAGRADSHRGRRSGITYLVVHLRQRQPKGPPLDAVPVPAACRPLRGGRGGGNEPAGGVR